jgi:hypothetical protein
LQVSVAKSLPIAPLQLIENNKSIIRLTITRLQNINCCVSLIAPVGASQRETGEAVEVVLLELKNQ